LRARFPALRAEHIGQDEYVTFLTTHFAFKSLYLRIRPQWIIVVQANSFAESLNVSSI